jgi:hypothetical protein
MSDSYLKHYFSLISGNGYLKAGGGSPEYCFNAVYVEFAVPVVRCHLETNGIILQDTLHRFTEDTMKVTFNLCDCISLNSNRGGLRELYLYYSYSANIPHSTLMIKKIHYYNDSLRDHTGCAGSRSYSSWPRLLIVGQGGNTHIIHRGSNICEPA